MSFPFLLSGDAGASTVSTSFESMRTERAPCTCMGETAAAGAVLTGIPLRGLLGTLWTGIFCPVLPARKKHGNIWISNPNVVRSGSHSVVTLHIYAPSTDRKYPFRSKQSLLTARKCFTTKYNVQIPEHPKSKDFISDLTVAADSGGVGDALLRQTPCQRLAGSDSRESTSSAASLQSTNHSTLRASTKCKHRFKVFIGSEANATTCRFYCNAHSEYSGPLLAVPGKH